MPVKPKVVNGFSPIYIALTELNFFNFVFFIRNTDSDKINGKYVVGDLLTQLKLIK